MADGQASQTVANDDWKDVSGAPQGGDWHAGSWVVFPGPAYWAQCTVGPANGGVVLPIGTYTGWVKIVDSAAVPVEQSFLLKITP